MRHWSATARCIEWKDDNTVLYRVKDWHGHKKLDQTLKYISLAKLYDDKAGSWLNRALKRRRNVGGKRGKLKKKELQQLLQITNNAKNGGHSLEFSPVENYGRGGIRTRDVWLRRPAPYPG